MTDDTPAAPSAAVVVRYWAAARAAAQVAEEPVAGATLADVLASVRARHPDPGFQRVLTASSLLVDGVGVGTKRPEDVRVEPGMTVEVLPPFAGG